MRRTRFSDRWAPSALVLMDCQRTEVAQYRAGVANLLAKSVAMTGRLERRLAAQLDLDADPTAHGRIMYALLLRKARLHTVAVLRANETNNVHSLAAQMRPVLECAGQVVFYFHNLIIAPDREHALNVAGDA